MRRRALQGVAQFPVLLGRRAFSESRVEKVALSSVRPTGMTFSGTACNSLRPFPSRGSARSAAETNVWGWFSQEHAMRRRLRMLPTWRSPGGFEASSLPAAAACNASDAPSARRARLTLGEVIAAEQPDR